MKEFRIGRGDFKNCSKITKQKREIVLYIEKRKKDRHIPQIVMEYEKESEEEVVLINETTEEKFQTRAVIQEAQEYFVLKITT